MITLVKKAGIFVAAVSAFTLLAIFSSTPTFASTAQPELNFDPRCISPSTGVAMFEINNKDTETINLEFRDEAGQGNVDLAPGINTVYVPYNEGQLDNNVVFTYGSSSQYRTEVQIHDECTSEQLPAPTCVDGTDASNLYVIWNNSSQIVITTKGGLPLCNDVTLYYSTYRMPDNYDGNGFSVDNTTSYPQTGVLSTEIPLLAYTYGTWIQNVPAPATCVNTQADIYYGPEVTNVGGDAKGYHADGTPIESGYGHGTQNIASAIFNNYDANCGATPGMGGGNGDSNGGEATGPIGGLGGVPSTTESTGTTTVPTILPNTGVDLSSNILSTVLSLMFGGTSLMALAARALRRD